MSDAVVHRLLIHHLDVPARPGRADARHPPEATTSTIVQLETTRGVVGYGEAPWSADHGHGTGLSISAAIERTLSRNLMEFHPASFPEALEAIEALPYEDAEGRDIRPARSAVELALLDLSMHVFDRDADAIVRWMGLPGFGVPGSTDKARLGGILEPDKPAASIAALRRMRWRGVTRFKLELGPDEDNERLNRVLDRLRRAIRRGRTTLSVDAGGWWSKDQAVEWFSDHDSLPISTIEQPFPRGREQDLPILKDLFDTPLVHDESLVSLTDAHRLNDLGVADVFHLDLTRCGGLMATLRIAGYARREAIRLQLGVSRYGTDVAIAAGLSFLRLCPGVETLDGIANGVHRPRRLARRRLRFGFSGRLPRLAQRGIGVEVDPDRLAAQTSNAPLVIPL